MGSKSNFTSNPSSKPSQKPYTPSVASNSPLLRDSSPSASAARDSKKPLGARFKKLLSDIGSPPTAEYDRRQLAQGRENMTDAQKAFAKIDFLPTLGNIRPRS
jgi:hypothetical protein